MEKAIKWGQETDFCVVTFSVRCVVPVGYEAEAVAAMIDEARNIVFRDSDAMASYVDVEAADEEIGWDDISEWIPGVPQRGLEDWGIDDYDNDEEE